MYLHAGLCWSEHSPLTCSPLLFFLSVSLPSLHLSSSDPSTPRVPKPVNQQIVNEGPSSKTEREKERETGGREEAQSGKLGRSFGPTVCLSKHVHSSVS